MCPGSVGREIWHFVLQEFFIEQFALSKELWAFAAPTGVIISSAVGTFGGVVGIALGGDVCSSTCSAYVDRTGAVASNVAKVLALSATDGFLFVLSDIDAFIVDADSVSKDVVGGEGISHLEKGEGLPLFRRTTCYQFDPLNGG
jgi:hypothetical protein